MTRLARPPATTHRSVPGSRIHGVWTCIHLVRILAFGEHWHCAQGDLGLDLQQLGMLQSAMLLGYLVAQARPAPYDTQFSGRLSRTRQNLRLVHSFQPES